jgi:hypothetical protein
MLRELRTVHQVYEVLGGVDKVAKIAHANWKQAWYWQGSAKKFPANTYVAIQTALAKVGCEARPSLFAMKGISRRAA